MSSELDLSDPDVWHMACSNHRPEETWSMGGELLAVSCRECGNGWPCETITLLRNKKHTKTSGDLRR